MATKEFCLITGASRGYGVAIARQYTEWKIKQRHSFDMVLIARSEQQLVELKVHIYNRIL